MKTIILILTLFTLRASAQLVADVTLSPMGSFKAKTPDIKGGAVVKGDTVTAQNIVVDLRHLDTGIELRNTHGRDKYLEVGKYPEAVLIKAEGKGGKGTGRLKFHGVEHDIAGTYEVKGNTVVAKFPIKLSDFKIEGISYKGIGVEDEVPVEITVPVVTAAAAPAPAAKAAPAKAAPAPAKAPVKKK